MGSRRVSLSRLFVERIESNSPYSTGQVKAQYTSGMKDFLTYCKEHGFTSNKKIVANGEGAVLKGYMSNMIAENKAPATINKYYNIACKCLNLTAEKATRAYGIEKPTVGARRCVKGTGSSERHIQDVKSGKFERLIAFAEKVGIRRSEYLQLKGSDLVSDLKDNLYIHVAKGKGGKETWQRVLPEHEGFMKDFFSSISPDEKCFTKKELNNKLDLHGAYRTKHAQDVYKYALEKVKTGNSEDLITEIKAQYNRFYFCKDKKDYSDYDSVLSWEQYKRKITSDKPYHVKDKSTQEKLKANGLGNDLNRLAVAYTSVFALSHWRLNVTVSNYLCR